MMGHLEKTIVDGMLYRIIVTTTVGDFNFKYLYLIRRKDPI